MESTTISGSTKAMAISPRPVSIAWSSPTPSTMNFCRRRVPSFICRPPLPARTTSNCSTTGVRQLGVIAGISELNDYNYRKPSADLSTHEAYPTPPERSRIYDYPGGYEDKSLGDRLTKVMQEAERPFEDRCTAGGYAPSLTPGFTIQRRSLDGDPQDNDYLILRCHHSYGDQSYASAGRGRAPPTDPTPGATSFPVSPFRTGCRSGRLSRALSARSRRRSSARRTRRSTSTNMGVSWSSFTGTTARAPTRLTRRLPGASVSVRSGRASIAARCLFPASATK